MHAKVDRITGYYPESFILYGFLEIFLNGMALGLFKKEVFNAQKRVHNAQIIVHGFRNGLKGWELFCKKRYHNLI